MLKNMETQHFRAGENIFLEGDQGGSVYLIDKGKVEISKKADYEKVILATLGWNEIFGEMALVDNNPRSATAKAIEDTWVYELKKSTFEQQLVELHPFMRAVFRVLVGNVRNMTNQEIRNNKQD